MRSPASSSAQETRAGSGDVTLEHCLDTRRCRLPVLACILAVAVLTTCVVAVACAATQSGAFDALCGPCGATTCTKSRVTRYSPDRERSDGGLVMAVESWVRGRAAAAGLLVGLAGLAAVTVVVAVPVSAASDLSFQFQSESGRSIEPGAFDWSWARVSNESTGTVSAVTLRIELPAVVDLDSWDPEECLLRRRRDDRLSTRRHPAEWHPNSGYRIRRTVGRTGRELLR